MGHCEVHKVFDSLWLITDEIFKHVSDIRNILNGPKGPEGEILSSCPPPYEESKSEQLIEHLKQKVTCLENLDEKRRVLLGEFSNALKSDDFDKKEETEEEPSEDESDSPINSALESLASYNHESQYMFKKNLDRLERSTKELFEFRNQIGETNTAEEGHIRGCSPEAQKMFYSAVDNSALYTAYFNYDVLVLLRKGKMLGEAILKVPHKANEETNKVLKNVQDLFMRILNADIPGLSDTISPILREYLENQTRFAITDMVNSMVISLQQSFIKRTQLVQEYSQALRSLAHDLIF